MVTSRPGDKITCIFESIAQLFLFIVSFFKSAYARWLCATSRQMNMSLFFFTAEKCQRWCSADAESMNYINRDWKRSWKRFNSLMHSVETAVSANSLTVDTNRGGNYAGSWLKTCSIPGLTNIILITDRKLHRILVEVTLEINSRTDKMKQVRKLYQR